MQEEQFQVCSAILKTDMSGGGYGSRYDSGVWSGVWFGGTEASVATVAALTIYRWRISRAWSQGSRAQTKGMVQRMVRV